MKVSIPRAWTVGKSISFDPEAGARAEAAVAALAAQISAGLGGNILHRNLAQLQVGDDHPQYTGNAFPETITGQWNFSTIPFIQGDTLAEYIEDVVGGSFFDFLQDTTSVVWTYHETANELEANVPPEFVQDVVGAMLTDTTSIDLAYNDAAGTFTASIIDEYVQDLVGAMLVDSTSIDFTYSDPAGTFTAVVLPAGVNHDLLLNYVADQHVAHSGVTLTAGAGLTGGGTIAASRTFAVGAGTGITVNADDVAIANTAVTPGSYTYASLTVDQQGRLTAASNGSAPAALANPSGLIGMSAVNGVATTALRSDGLHAIDPAITPEWTATHGWADNAKIQLGTGDDLQLYHDGTNSFISNGTGVLLFEGAGGDFYRNDAAGTTRQFGFRSGNLNRWLFRCTNQTESGSNAGSNFQWLARADSGGALFAVMTLVRATGEVALEAGAAAFLRLTSDNQELQLGAGNDLRLYHDGTNSFIENDTGNLVVKVNGELDLEEVTTSTGTNIPTIGTNKPGSAVSLTPSTWLTLIVNGTTYYLPLWV